MDLLLPRRPGGPSSRHRQEVLAGTVLFARIVDELGLLRAASERREPIAAPGAWARCRFAEGDFHHFPSLLLLLAPLIAHFPCTEMTSVATNWIKTPEAQAKEAWRRCFSQAITGSKHQCRPGRRATSPFPVGVRIV